MAVLKYKSNGTIKTLGITKSGASSVTSVNGKTGAVTGLYDADNPPPYPVSSVNGKTGAVTGLYDANNPPPYPVSSVNGKTGDVTGLYDANNQPPYPVSSVNGKTGAVTGLYDANNQPPYPVRSVNGKTGVITGLYDADNQPPYPVLSVDGKTGAVQTLTIIEFSESELPVSITTYSKLVVISYRLNSSSSLGKDNTATYRVSFNSGYPIPISASFLGGGYGLQISVTRLTTGNEFFVNLTNHSFEGPISLNGSIVVTFIPNGATQITGVSYNG